MCIMYYVRTIIIIEVHRGEPGTEYRQNTGRAQGQTTTSLCVPVSTESYGRRIALRRALATPPREKAGMIRNCLAIIVGNSVLRIAESGASGVL